MTLVETIEAAIKKLTEQRDAAMQGPWRHIIVNYYGQPAPGIWAEAEGEEIGYLLNQADADLLVTLHATIDAQLAILTEGRETCIGIAELGFGNRAGVAQPAADLARAIVEAGA